MDRSSFSTRKSIHYLWETLGLPAYALDHFELNGQDKATAPSSFKIGHLAQSAIATSGLLAALVFSTRQHTEVPTVAVDRRHATIEFFSEKLCRLNGKALQPPWGTIGGLHETKDGHVRVHDSLKNHYDAALRLLDCRLGSNKAEFAAKIIQRQAFELEKAAVEAKAVVFAMRTFREWDTTPQAQAVVDFPITITKIADSPACLQSMPRNAAKCLTGIRILEMSRVIAAPVAGRTLAAHGADVLWVTSPNLPDLPALDKDTGRGKRTTQLDIDTVADKEVLLDLLREADVFLQSYRPGSLAAKGLSIGDLLVKRERPLICASLSAWGDKGPWAERRGFDSIVQTVSGMNVSEAEHFGMSKAKVMPCQALDHGAGYLLATGILTALYRQMTEGGSYQVDVSLAGVMKYLRSLGQYEGNSGYACQDYKSLSDVPAEFVEKRESWFGELEATKHTIKISGLEVGWDLMPKPLGSDQPRWIAL